MPIKLEEAEEPRTVGQLLEGRVSRKPSTVGDVSGRFIGPTSLETIGIGSRPITTVGDVAGRVKKPIPLPPINLHERLPSTPQASSAVEGLSGTISEIGWDLALMGLAGVITAGVGVTGPVSLPVIGLTYGALKLAERGLRGKPPQKTITEELMGEEYPVMMKPVAEAAEWAMFPVIGKGAKSLLKGIQKVSQLEPIKPLAEKVWDNVIVKTTEWPFPIAGKVGERYKTLREAFQPAIERLRKDMPEAAEIFREAKTQESLARGMTRRLMKETETLLPMERYELLKGLTGTSLGELRSGRVKELIRSYEKELVASTTGRYRSSFKKQFQKMLYEPIEEIETQYLPESIRKRLHSFEKVLTGKEVVKPKEVNALLDSVIQNPRVANRMKLFAKDLYNIPAKAPIDIAKSTSHATNEYIVSKLIQEPGMVSSKALPGYIASKHPSLKGVFIPKDVELELEAMRKVPQIALKAYNKWFMSPWKTNKVILRPATHFRNMISNLILNDWGGLPFYRADIYTKAASELKNKGPIYKELRSMVGELGTFGTEEVGLLTSSLKYEANMFDKALAVYDQIAAPARAMYSAEESWFKLAKYMHNLEKGMPKLDAAYDALRWTMNYGEITPSVAALRTKWWGAPFATWQTKVLPLTIETAVKHPIRFFKWVALGLYLQNYAIQNVGLTEAEWQSIHATLPEYMQKGLYLLMPWRDEKQQLKMLNLTWMIPGIGDMAEMVQRGETNPLSVIIQNPMVGAITTIQSKKKYSGAPLYYEWESATTKWSKVMAFLWEMWSPAPTPGNVDWRSLWDAIQETPEALTPEEAIAGQFGFRLTTISPQQMARRKEALRRIHESEMSTQMKRELRRTKNPEEIKSILEKYRQLKIEEVQR